MSVDGQRCADPRHDVLSLRVDQILAVENIFSGGGIAGEGHARTTIFPHVPIGVRGDICDRALLDRLLAEHRAARDRAFRGRSPCRSLDPRARRVRPDQHRRHLHAAGSGARLLEQLDGAAQERFRFLHVSTDEVYGSLGPSDAPFTETTPYAAQQPLFRLKAASDHLVRA